tara:strand:- start:338 stop:481 length:144 start_codon:yes stop_codon:yes gene_type:complete
MLAPSVKATVIEANKNMHESNLISLRYLDVLVKRFINVLGNSFMLMS